MPQARGVTPANFALMSSSFGSCAEGATVAGAVEGEGEADVVVVGEELTEPVLDGDEVPDVRGPDGVHAASALAPAARTKPRRVTNAHLPAINRSYARRTCPLRWEA